MGCPILLGFAEKTNEVAKNWEKSMVMDRDYPPNLLRQAMAVPDPYRDLLERRAEFALHLIVTDMLKRAVRRSEMSNDLAWFNDIPSNLEPTATREVLERIKDRAVAWNLQYQLAEGKAGDVLERPLIKRVWEIVTIADNLMHDMLQGSYITAGTALAYAMASLRVEMPEWMAIFEQLKEIT